MFAPQVILARYVSTMNNEAFDADERLNLFTVTEYYILKASFLEAVMCSSDFCTC